MASKGQKFIKYTTEQKTTALELVTKKGLTFASHELNININTIASWQFEKRNQKNYVFKPSKLEKENDKLKRELKKEVEKRNEMKTVTKKFLSSLGIK